MLRRIGEVLDRRGLPLLPRAELVLGDGGDQRGHLVAEHHGDLLELDAGVLHHVVEVRRTQQVLVRAARREQRRDGDAVQDVRLVAALPLLAPVRALGEPQGGSCPLRVDHEAQLTQRFEA